jgi:hypothetical protein
VARAWTEVSGPDQIALMGAASRAVQGDLSAKCPHGDDQELRFYFHRMNDRTGTGTMWVWCPVSRIAGHIPRVRPVLDRLRDPFGDLALEEFAALEVARDVPFLDRLDRLWEEGAILHVDG